MATIEEKEIEITGETTGEEEIEEGKKEDIEKEEE